MRTNPAIQAAIDLTAGAAGNIAGENVIFCKAFDFDVKESAI